MGSPVCIDLRGIAVRGAWHQVVDGGGCWDIEFTVSKSL